MRAPRRGAPAAPIGTALIAEVRAALAAGAPPGPALAAAVSAGAQRGHPPPAGPRGRARQPADGDVHAVARRMALGTPVADVAATVATGDAAADLLVRALAVVERAGAGALAAVDQVLAAVRDEVALRRLVRVRTTQARGTAVVLTLVPVVIWVLLVAVDGAALRFYRTPAGIVTGLAAVCLAGGGQWWSRRLVRRAAAAAAAADPLSPPVLPWRPGRAAVVGLPALVVLGAAAGPGAGLLAALVAGLAAARPARGRGRRPGAGTADGGAAETVELVAMALQAGLAPTQAVALVAPLAPPPARGPLSSAAARLRAGWGADAAFAGTGLAVLGAALDACERWGAPAGEVLCRVADDLRADRRAAAEEAAERTQLALIFPTTLLTLPAFVLAVVPPLVWTAFGS